MNVAAVTVYHAQHANENSFAMVGKQPAPPSSTLLCRCSLCCVRHGWVCRCVDRCVRQTSGHQRDWRIVRCCSCCVVCHCLTIVYICCSYPDGTFGAQSRFGIPFIFLLRDILQFDQTLDDAVSRMADTRRTCDLILGVGDAKVTVVACVRSLHNGFLFLVCAAGIRARY